jgi:hypothetical protein
LIVEVPPCKPQGGINTDWSGNKCSILPVGAKQSALLVPQARPEVPKMEQSAPQATEQPAPQVKPDVGTVGQSRTSQSDHAPTFSTLGFDIAVALILALAFVVVRRFLLDPFGGEEGVERDDAA